MGQEAKQPSVASAGAVQTELLDPVLQSLQLVAGAVENQRLLVKLKSLVM